VEKELLEDEYSHIVGLLQAF